MKRDFAGKTVVITGAAGGLGRALAHAFAVGKGARPVNHLWPVREES